MNLKLKFGQVNTFFLKSLHSYLCLLHEKDSLLPSFSKVNADSFETY